MGMRLLIIPSIPLISLLIHTIERIREVVSDRIQCEEERIPSYTSLWRHWMRSCWISTMWRNSHTDDLYTNLPDPHLNGWLLSEDGLYSIDWEDEKVKSEIEKHISVLLKGCKCKTKCGMRCGCRKKQAYCGPGCECQYKILAMRLMKTMRLM